MEELVAELGSAFLAADLGLTPEVREDLAAYIGSWLKVLKNDNRPNNNNNGKNSCKSLRCIAGAASVRSNNAARMCFMPIFDTSWASIVNVGASF